MIYSDDELRRWWKGLTHGDRAEILDVIDQRSSARAWVQNLNDTYAGGLEFTPAQLAAMRKWEK